MLNIDFPMGNNFWVFAATRTIRALCRAEYDRFQKSLAQPQTSQERLFRKIIKDLAQTDYGKQHSITGQEDYLDFAAKIPIRNYEDLEPWISKQLSSNRPLITPHRIIHVEPTSGSSGAIKRIPYTKPLLESFSSMFSIWAHDQLCYGFKPKTGRIFMSISPPSTKLGFANDGEYLTEPLRSLVAPFLVSLPRNVSLSDFQHKLAVTLLLEDKLEVISIWSPSYLLILLAYIQINRNKLASLLPCNQRSRLLDHSPIDWEKIWPHLKLISCWDSALAEPLANQVRELFPNVQVQGKGLLATEAPITVPLIGAAGSVPLVNKIFLEFEAKNGGMIKRLHELTDREQYQVIMSQSAGLTRYRLNDLIEVRGFYRSTPRLAFMGRANHVCDMAGEKLHEDFVCRTLTPLMAPGHFLLVPSHQKVLGYVLLTDQLQEGLAERADQALCEAHHYCQARCLGQISPLQTIFVPNLLGRLQSFHQTEGMRLGNIKDSSLMTDLEQAKRLLTLLSDEQYKPALPPLETSEQNNPSHQVHLQQIQLQADA